MTHDSNYNLNELENKLLDLDLLLFDSSNDTEKDSIIEKYIELKNYLLEEEKRCNKKNKKKIYRIYRMKEDIFISIEDNKKYYNEENRDERISNLHKLINLSNNFKDRLHYSISLANIIEESQPYEALLICDKIINNTNFESLNAKTKANTLSIRISILKNILLNESYKKEHINNLNREIVRNYDQIIEYYKDMEKFRESNLERKFQYLQSMLFIEENKKSILEMCDKAIEFTTKNKCAQMKMNILNRLGKYEECIYYYESNVEDNFSNDWSFVSYIDSLYRIRDIQKIKNKINNYKIINDTAKFCLLRIKINIAIKEKDTESIEKMLKQIDELELSYYMKCSADDFKCRTLEELLKISNKDKCDHYKQKLEKKYYEDMNEKDMYEMYHEVHSNFGINILNSNISGPYLYHYTSINALKGILENKEFWVTGANYLNDYNERKHILNYVESVCKILKESEFRDCLYEVCKGLRYFFNCNDYESDILNNSIKKYIDNKLKVRLTDFYILSLSTDKDSLALWGNYSNNEGYNLEINIEKLMKDITSPSMDYNEYSYAKCASILYIDVPQNQDDIDNNDKLYLNIKEYYDNCKKYNIDKDKIICGLLANIIFIGLFTKDKAFSPEQEYRIIFSRIEDEYNSKEYNTNFRIKDGAFIPYIKVPFSYNCINGICIGPNNKSDIAKNGLIELLQYNNFTIEPEKISKSKISLRY